MRFVRRSPISPSMVVALIALAVALGGSAYAADGGFAGPDGSIQGCVTQPGLIHSITGTAGAVLVVAPGETCPAGTTPQSLSANAQPELDIAQSMGHIALGHTNKALAETVVKGGSYLVNAIAHVSEPGQMSVEQTIECSMVGPHGNSIPGTTSSATIPANTPGEKLTIPISVVVYNLPAGGTVSLDCKDAPLRVGAVANNAAKIIADLTLPSGGTNADGTADLSGCCENADEGPF